MFRWGIPIIFIGILITAFVAEYSRDVPFLGAVREIVLESFRGFKGSPREYLAAEISLEGDHDSSFNASREAKKEDFVVKKEEIKIGRSPSGGELENKEISQVHFDKRGDQLGTYAIVSASSGFSATGIYENASEGVQMACDFFAGGTPSREAIISEVAWMGRESSASDEWIEIAGMGSEKISIAGWRLMTESGKVNTAIGIGKINRKEFFLLERTDDDTVPDISADLIYKGALSNTGEWLRLFDHECRLMDEVDARAGWPAGDNAAKRTMERRADLTWQTSSDIGGTPRGVNSSGVFSEELKIEDKVSPQGETIPSSTAANTSFFVVISEVFYDAEGSDSGREFIELYNKGSVEVHLTNWKIIYNGDSIATLGGKIDDITTILPGGYFLIGFFGYNGTPSAQVVRSTSLGNGAATILLLDSTGVAVHEISYDGSLLPGQSVGRVGDGTALQPIIPSPGE